MSDSTGDLDAVKRGVINRKTPLETARKFNRERYWCEAAAPTNQPTSTLCRYAGEFYVWDRAAYRVVADETLRVEVNRWLDCQYREAGKDDKGATIYARFSPDKRDVDAVVHALMLDVPHAESNPQWLGDEDLLCDVSRLAVCRNGIFDVDGESDGLLCQSTPLMFTSVALDFDYDPEAKCPQWLRFLDSVWPDDRESIELLQTWFGYCMTGDTSHHKILLMCGASRAGKGVCARVLEALVGRANTCGLDVASLAGTFGLQPLLGKRLAVSSDLRLSGKPDHARIAQNLLSLSGGDTLTVARKYKDEVLATSHPKIVVMTNLTPHLHDASGALASRFLALKFSESFAGREDRDLDAKLRGELPGILNWAIEGWRRLQERGRFVQPQTGEEIVSELGELASPVSAFIEECCVVCESAKIEVTDLYDAWRQWCAKGGYQHPGDVRQFSRNVRSVATDVAMCRLRTGGGRQVRGLLGIALSEEGRAVLNEWRPAA